MMTMMKNCHSADLWICNTSEPLHSGQTASDPGQLLYSQSKYRYRSQVWKVTNARTSVFCQ